MPIIMKVGTSAHLELSACHFFFKSKFSVCPLCFMAMQIVIRNMFY
jgi:hypothetical protein